ncbi:MAG TPA: hypothetical protein VMN37_11880 [Gemmatimonadales bacterium]|nr:hypothetical protein [Gemmatimonadales bacterium]
MSVAPASLAGAHWRLARLYEREERAEQYRLAASLDPRLRPGSWLSRRMESRI